MTTANEDFPPPTQPTRVHRPLFTRENWRRYRKWLLVIPVLFFVAMTLMYDSVVMGFTPPQQIILAPKGIEILDRNGQLLYTFDEQPGASQIVPYDQISPDLIKATVATEDANFWNNPGGMSVKGILRATYENVAFWKHGGLFKGSGGSSITQQLAKNVYIDPNDRAARSPIRKIKESLLAFELNRRYSKQQILSWYLSVVNYGNGAYGVNAASYKYFNKPPKDLTLAEASLLAGLPKAPSTYDPLLDLARAQERQKQVLSLMVQHGVISKQQGQEAGAQKLAITRGEPPGQVTSAHLAPHFAVYVREQLPQLLGPAHLGGKLRITTSIDANLQKQAEDTVKAQLDKFEKSYGATNGGLVAMDPNTGEIVAMVGSHDFNREDISGQVNNVLAMNQPGSTMKPITYLTAFLKGWSPSTMITDEPLKMTDGDSSYTLGNADKKYRGPVPARTALGSSLNVPAVKTLQFATLPSVYQMARRMGITSLKEIGNYGPAFTLGGVDVDLMDMTYAFSIFAGGGDQVGMRTVQKLPDGSRRLDPVAVLRIEGTGGVQLYKVDERRDHVVPPNAAYLVTNILSDDSARVSMFGANSAMNLQGRPAAVKTGSSDDTRDLLAIGYTPQLITGVWVGNADNSPMTGTSSLVAAPIWQAFMQAALKDKPVMQFPVPDGIEYARVCATTGLPPTSGCPKTVQEVFMAGHLPQGAKPEKPGQQPAQQAPAAPAPAPKAPVAPQVQPSPVPQQPQVQLPPQQAGQPPFPTGESAGLAAPQAQQGQPGQALTPAAQQVQPTPQPPIRVVTQTVPTPVVQQPPRPTPQPDFQPLNRPQAQTN